MMSYLLLPGGAQNSTKATVSLWFRISQAAMDAAMARSWHFPDVPFPPDAFLYWGAVPVLTFGPPPPDDADGLQSGSSWLGACWNRGFQDNPSRNFCLALNLQYADRGSIPESERYQYDTGFPECIYFGIQANVNIDTVLKSSIPVSADQWHHALISWDISGSIATHLFQQPDDSDTTIERGVDSAVPIYVAFDDRNYTGTDIFAPCGGYKGGNGFVTANAYLPASYIQQPDIDPPAEFSWTPTPLPVSGSPLGLPTAGLIKFNPHVELAEFQFFTGVVVNTSNAANRRAFIDKDGKPAKPAEAEKLLGKKPDILLHGSGNWKKGKNTGTGGQFTPAGTINAYKPEPSLHG